MPHPPAAFPKREFKMAASDTQTAHRAHPGSGEQSWPAPASQPGGADAVSRVPGGEWATPAFLLTVIITGAGFLTLCFGMFVIENALVWIAGLIVMDVGIVGWMLVASCVVVAYIRAYFASRRKAERPAAP